MSVVYCEYCDQHIDTDYNAEHFTDDGECIQQGENIMKCNHEP